MGVRDINQRVDALRHFNRFYTRQIGVLDEHMLNTPYSLSEARVLYELANSQQVTATQVADELGIDAGYLSRMLASFERKGLITRKPLASDRRKRIPKLAARGRSVYRTLANRARDDVKSMLADIPVRDQERTIRAMATIREVLNDRATVTAPVVIRTHRPGDIGWIVERHGAIYTQERQWDQTFEALVAEILVELIRVYDHRKDHIWIAEIDSKRAGCIVMARADDAVVKLRLFLVEPWARGRGIGRQLVEESIRFSRRAGYRKITLWTQSELHAARHLYEEFGFHLVAEKAHHSFGHDLVGENWDLELT